MVTISNDMRLASTTASILAIVAIGALLVPAASATGYLVNVQTGYLDVQHGSNVLGGAGDTVDVGYQNYQCTDEDDVVDVGIQNREGDEHCRWTQEEEGCQAEEGGETRVTSRPLGIDERFELGSPVGDAASPLFDTSKERRTHCSDDGDTVDVGIMNDEGGFGDQVYVEECAWYHEEHEHDPDREAPGGDDGDAIDVGVMNRECADRNDAVDAGIMNCEVVDRSDGIDLGVGNLEIWDEDDTLDVSLFSTEISDGPDGNGANLFPGGGLGEACYNQTGLPRLSP